MKKVFTLISGFVLLITHPILRAEEMAWGIVCPPNKTIYCTSDLYNLSQHGNAYFQGHYGQIQLSNPTVTYHLNSCNIGYITRTWTYMGPNWNTYSCTQTIDVVANPNQQPQIYWPPAVVELEGCDPDIHPTVTGRPTFGYSQCAHLGYAWKDQVFTVSDQCKKIIRKWTVIDWCVNTPQNPHAGIWYFNQTLIIADDEVPNFQCPAPIVAKADNCQNGKVIVPPLVLDNSPCGGEYVITNNSPYAYSNGADISGVYPVGKTKVKYIVQYGCGYKRACEVEVTVKDNKPPTPICLSKVTIPLMPVHLDNDGIPDDGMVEIWAKDLNHKSTPACNRGPLTFAFSPDPSDMKKVFTCDDLGENLVKMYAIDSKGNYDFCEVSVVVQNNAANIPDCKRKEDDNNSDDGDHSGAGLQITGSVSKVSGEPMEGVELALSTASELMEIVVSYDTIKVQRMDSMINHSGAKLYFFFEDTKIVEFTDTIVLSSLDLRAFTDSLGYYAFKDSLVENVKYVLKCLGTAEVGEYLSPADADRLLAHLLGTQSFSEAWEYIAADVNIDGTVNLDDLNLLLKVIMGEEQNFGHDQTWVFTLSELLQTPNFEDILDNYTNIFETDSLNTALTGVNFTGIQLGKLVDSNTATSQHQLRNAQRASDPKFMVFPNPFTDELSVRIHSCDDIQGTFQIADLTGKQVFLQNVAISKTQQNYTFNPVGLIPGAYIYRIVLKDKIETGLIIKN